MNRDILKTDKFLMQDNEYEFPYHYLPNIKGGKFNLGRQIAHGAGYLCYIRIYAEYINSLHPQKFADIGCGDGRLFSFLDKNINKMGCDLSERATLFAKAFNPEVKIYCADVSELPKGEQDVVSLIEVLEHIPDEEVSSFIKKVYALLKVGGHLLISVPSVNLKPIPVKHYRHYTFSLLKEELDQAGISYRIIGNRYIMRYDLIYKILQKLSSNHLFCIRGGEQLLWNYTWKHLRDADERTGIHIFLDIKKI